MKRNGILLLLLLIVLGMVRETAVSAPIAEGEQLIYLPLITKPSLQLGPNLLPNPSFEGGWYHPNGIPELQIPDGWLFSWDEGPTGFGTQPWDVWVRPEVRVLPSEQLPPDEQPLFIWEGNQTLKIFKGWGAISFRLTTSLNLQPGTYLMDINFFPDLVIDYVNGEKVFATDPLAGEVAFIVDGVQTAWILPTFGEQNNLTHTFTLEESDTISIGIAMRGRYALLNNGWFMDDWSLQQIITSE
jgi:hypothetical protein